MAIAAQVVVDFILNKDASKIHGDITLPDLQKVFGETKLNELPSSLEAVFKECLDTVVKHSVHTSHPYFVGHMTSNVPYFAYVVDVIISALNQNVVKIETALSASFVEGQTVAWLHKFIYKKSDEFYEKTMHEPGIALGNMTSGGTLGNMTALSVARSKCLPGVERKGLCQVLKEKKLDRVVILASTRVHYSVKKVASLLGLGSESVISIPVHEYTNKINISALRETLDKLKTEKALVLSIVGIAGSTETGSIDELQVLSEICKENKIWFHVDAAWGGPLLLSNSHDKLLKGIASADSVTMDGHKLFYLTMSQGCVLFKDEKMLSSIRHHANYIIRHGSVDLGQKSLEGSRRFDSLKMWFALKVLGRQGYGSLMDESLKDAKDFSQCIDTNPQFELTSLVETNILTYRFLPKGWKQSFNREVQSKDAEFVKCLDDATHFLNDVNVEVQKIQRQNGKSFVSRTTLESVQKGLDVVVLRAVVFNTKLNSGIFTDILKEQEEIGNEVSRQKWQALSAPIRQALSKVLPECR